MGSSAEAGGAVLQNITLVNDVASVVAWDLVYAVNTTVTVALNVWNAIPGHQIIWRYIKASHQNDPGRTVVEVVIFLWLLAYIFRNRVKPASDEIKLTKEEVEDLIREWEPEPLVPEELTDVQKMDLERVPVIVGAANTKVKIRGSKNLLTNLSSYNFLGLLNRDEAKKESLAALRKYGVGTCGPRGFYGTLDVHMQLEKELATFMGTEDGIIYSQGFATVSSVIPSFAKRGDIIVVDDAVNYSIQKGVQISRSTVKWFRHNDMDHLQSILEEITRDAKRKNKPLTRRFIVVEGLYANTGDLCNLPKLVDLKFRYKFRLVVDESLSIGTLGASGRGVSEHFNIPTASVDVIAATMANSLGAGGGFCVGSKEVVDHQRLSSSAYVFSASLPSILAVTAMTSLSLLDEEPSKFIGPLRENTQVLRSVLGAIPGVSCVGAEVSPVMHLRLKERLAKRDEEEFLLQDVVEEAMKDGVLVTRAKYVPDEVSLPPPSIRVCATAALTKKESEKAAQTLRNAFFKAMARRSK
ncbi:pyridoxal phosphate-dependent transferase [Hyaloraphidium curvatum]|nr:pyridoxal phosphate-dependent transferase [Hyaloraphidium curvatum]